MSVFHKLLLMALSTFSSLDEALPRRWADVGDQLLRRGRPSSAHAVHRWRGSGQTAGSPKYLWIFQNPLPIPPVAEPVFTDMVNGRPIRYYEQTIKHFQKYVYPNLGPANLVGYNGIAPGATFDIPRGTESIVRYLNNGSQSAAVHLHGSYTLAVWDGWALDEIQPGEWKDYYYPNTETARPIWYHDHAYQNTAGNAYYGQTGCYIITDPSEDSLGLPKAKYDIPLAFSDKVYQSNGDLASPNKSVVNFFGDIIEVNYQPWPYLEVEPRKYRFRLFDMSLSRAYHFYLADRTNTSIQFQVIGSDSGLFSTPVNTKDLTMSPGERYEIVIDFSGFKGQNVTLMNGMQLEQISEFENTDKIMRFVVGEVVSDASNNNVPTSLNSNIAWPVQHDTIDREFNFQKGGADTWTINGVSFSDPNNRVLARPPQGSVERWRIKHTGGSALHPVHVHLVNMQVLSRTGGARKLAPYEAAGLKDVISLAPGDTVDIMATYGPWNGMYMFHCHNLIHEDHTMMAAFNVTLLATLGYDFNSTTGFGNPVDSQFRARPSNPAAFAIAAKHSAVSSLGSLNAYQSVTSLIAAEKAYYATVSVTDIVTPTSTTTASISSENVFAPTNASPTSIVSLHQSRPWQ